MKELTYHEIRIKALKNNVRDNKLQIGMWAQFNGYMKRRECTGTEDIILYISHYKD